MSDRLIIQSHGTRPDAYERWLALTRPIHEAYAEACDADYELFVGVKERGVHPAWNRLPMFLDAFAAGYRHVAWIDADCLVVDQRTSIFDVDPATPLLMRTAGMVWLGEFCWNDGVLIANAGSIDAEAALRWVWAQRHAPLREHHAPSMWELNWLLDYVFEHRSIVGDLDERFNWMPFAEACPEAEAVICGWHGMPHGQRWEYFTAKLRATYGIEA